MLMEHEKYLFVMNGKVDKQNVFLNLITFFIELYSMVNVSKQLKRKRVRLNDRTVTITFIL